MLPAVRYSLPDSVFPQLRPLEVRGQLGGNVLFQASWNPPGFQLMLAIFSAVDLMPLRYCLMLRTQRTLRLVVVCLAAMRLTTGNFVSSG